MCRLEKECSVGKFWNYFRRQLYVMDTYTNKHNKHLNHTMLALHSYLSLVFVTSAMVSTAQLAAWIHDRAVLGLEAASRPPDACLAFFAAFLAAHAALRWMTGTDNSHNQKLGCAVPAPAGLLIILQNRLICC